jgi:mRNA interferase RelE/StbE
MSWQFEFEPEAINNLESLTQVLKTRIARKIRWLVSNFDQISPEPLTGNLAGYFKLRVGDYLVIYSINGEERIIMIDKIGHRREIYN